MSEADKNASNLETACLSHMASNGIPFSGPLKMDGKIHRFSIDPKTNEPDEFYCSSMWQFKDCSYLKCYYGTWRGGKQEYIYKSYGDLRSLSKEDYKRFKADEKHRENEHQERIKKETAERLIGAQKKWEQAKDVPSHGDHIAYLERKKIKAYDVRYSIDSVGNHVLVIPIRNIHYEIQAVQYIKADGEKRIHGVKKGNFHILGEIESDRRIYVAEGYATAYSDYEATGSPVVVAFDCGNIESVIVSLKTKYPTNTIIIAGDDDRRAIGNPGRTHAEKAAKKHNCSIVFPKFPEDFVLPNGMSPTDFNDLHVHFGIDIVRKQLCLKTENPLPEAERMQQNASYSQKRESEPVFRPFTFSELCNMPPKKWLVDQIFGAGEIGIFYGLPGCGKTFIVIDLIISICFGKMWARRFAVNAPLNVAYCAGEGISGLPSRFTTAAKYHDVALPNNFTFFKIIPQLYLNDDTSVTATIKQFVHEWKARQLAKEAEALDVLVIDTFHTATTAADENSAKDMGKILHLCRWAAHELGCTVILVHHTNKNGTAERGSSALRGSMDFMIEIAKLNDAKNAIMSCSKLKDGEQWKPQSFHLCKREDCESVHVLWNDSDLITPPLKSKVKSKKDLLNEMEQHIGKRFTCKSLAKIIAKKENYTLKLLNELEHDRKCKKELSDPNKKPSSRNHWLFYVDSQTEKAVV